MVKKKSEEAVEIGSVDNLEIKSKENVEIKMPEPSVSTKKTTKKSVFYTVNEYGIIRGIKRGKLASFKVGIKKNVSLEPKTLEGWDTLYNDFYGKKE